MIWRRARIRHDLPLCSSVMSSAFCDRPRPSPRSNPEPCAYIQITALQCSDVSLTRIIVELCAGDGQTRLQL